VYVPCARFRGNAYHGEDGGEHLDLLAQVGDLVVPVEHHASLADHEHQVGLRVCLAQAVVRPGTEHEPVLGLLVRVAGDPALGLERVGVGVGLGVVQGQVGGGDDHGALGDGVLGCDGEVLLGEVGNHDYGRAVAQGLLDDRTGPGQLLKRVERDLSVDVAVAGFDVLLADLLEELGAVGHDLEEPCGSRRGSVLGGEEEGEDGHGDLEVAEPADDHGGLLRVFALLDGLAVVVRLDHVGDPEVQNALLLAASRHTDLSLGGALGELVQNHVGALLAVPALGEGQDDGEVDELEGGGDEVVVVGDLLDGLLGAVVANEGPAADGGDQQAELLHEGDVLALVGDLGELDEALVVLVVDFLLAGQVLLERLAREEAVEALAVVDVGLAVEEDPVLGPQQLVRGVDHAGLDEVGRVEDLAGHVARRGDDDELVEDGHAAERAGRPLGVVFAEVRVDRLEEGSDEGHLHGGADDGALLVDVHDCARQKIEMSRVSKPSVLSGHHSSPLRPQLECRTTHTGRRGQRLPAAQAPPSRR
jgi:hypothetical protein